MIISKPKGFPYSFLCFHMINVIFRIDSSKENPLPYRQKGRDPSKMGTEYDQTPVLKPTKGTNKHEP